MSVNKRRCLRLTKTEDQKHRKANNTCKYINVQYRQNAPTFSAANFSHFVLGPSTGIGFSRGSGLVPGGSWRNYTCGKIVDDTCAKTPESSRFTGSCEVSRSSTWSNLPHSIQKKLHGITRSSLNKCRRVGSAALAPMGKVIYFNLLKSSGLELSIKRLPVSISACQHE